MFSGLHVNKGFNCHLVTWMWLILGSASPPLGRCRGRIDVIALSVKGSRPMDSCSSCCGHFSFQRGSPWETTDSSPGSSIPLANNLFSMWGNQLELLYSGCYVWWSSVVVPAAKQDTLCSRVHRGRSDDLFESLSLLLPGMFNLNLLKLAPIEKNIFFDPVNFFFLLRKEVIQRWVYGDYL